MHLRDTEEPVKEPDWAAFIAVDWADQKHDWAMEVPGENTRERGQVAHSPEALDVWVMQLRQRFGDRPIAVALEQSRGALLFTLSNTRTSYCSRFTRARQAVFAKQCIRRGVRMTRSMLTFSSICWSSIETD